MNELREVDDWDIEISSKHSLFDLKLQQLWSYRDLLWMFVLRDFKAVYKQTILGPIWFFIQPIFTTAVYVFVFGKLAGLSTDGVPPPLFYLPGIMAWGYFQGCLTGSANAFLNGASIFGKVYFPRVILPLSTIISNLIRLGVQLILLICMIVYFLFSGVVIQPSIYLLLFPVLIFLLAMQGLGLGMIVSALTTKYRDLVMLLTFGMQLLMYATPVVYPLSSLSGNMKLIISLNPASYIMEGLRKGLYGVGTFDMMSFLYVSVITVVLVVSGLISFNKAERNFIDTI